MVVVNHRLDPVETELRLHVKVADLTPTTQIRGRLLGPRCVYASTIEIAYPLRELARDGHIELRVVIPEPSWWDPESPFLYEGAVELWQDDVLCDRAEICHGIRWLQVTSKGVRLNGAPFMLRGTTVGSALSAKDAQKLRADGVNTLLATVGESGIEIWNAADRLGFFVLGMSDDPTRFVEWRNELAGHASTFGWVFNRAEFRAGPSQDDERAMFYGVNTSAATDPSNADFLLCHERELAWLEEIALPKIVFAERVPEPLPARTDVIGWIESPTV
jgi:hypothetical protein